MKNIDFDLIEKTVKETVLEATKATSTDKGREIFTEICIETSTAICIAMLRAYHEAISSKK